MPAPFHIHISIANQMLTLFEVSSEHLNGLLRWQSTTPGQVRLQVPISSSKNGVGQQRGSYQTPLGRHYIRAKIGQGAAENTVFVRRRPTGEIWSPALAQEFTDRDWILTRILWLCGMEPGKNRLGEVDTMRRFVYLHGSPDIVEMGKPGSIGCIRMRNSDIVELFDVVPAGTTVEITES
jgi:L,D-transpeptidase YbiS